MVSGLVNAGGSHRMQESWQLCKTFEVCFLLFPFRAAISRKVVHSGYIFLKFTCYVLSGYESLANFYTLCVFTQGEHINILLFSQNIYFLNFCLSSVLSGYIISKIFCVRTWSWCKRSCASPGIPDRWVPMIQNAGAQSTNGGNRLEQETTLSLILGRWGTFHCGCVDPIVGKYFQWTWFSLGFRQQGDFLDFTGGQGETKMAKNCMKTKEKGDFFGFYWGGALFPKNLGVSELSFFLGGGIPHPPCRENPTMYRLKSYWENLTTLKYS